MSKNDKETKIVIHLGMPKTATTFLQWNVFHYMDVNYLWHFFHKSWIKNIIHYDKEVDLEKAKIKIQKYLEPDKINLFSEENLYTDYLVKKDDRFILLDRIKYLFPKAKIIFGIREKEPLLISWYKQYVATGGTENYEYFLKQHMNQKKLDNEEYLDKLKEYYGEKNIFVYSLEEIKKDQEKVVGDMSKFIGVKFPDDYNRKPTNVGYSLETLNASLLINKIFRTRLNPKGIIPFPHFILPQRILFQNAAIRKRLPQTKITNYSLQQVTGEIDSIKNLFYGGTEEIAMNNNNMSDVERLYERANKIKEYESEVKEVETDEIAIRSEIIEGEKTNKIVEKPFKKLED